MEQGCSVLRPCKVTNHEKAASSHQNLPLLPQDLQAADGGGNRLLSPLLCRPQDQALHLEAARTLPVAGFPCVPPTGSFQGQYGALHRLRPLCGRLSRTVVLFGTFRLPEICGDS